MKNQVTTEEILDAVNHFSTEIVGEIQGIKSDISGINGRMATKEELADVKQDLATTKLEIFDRIDKIAGDVRGDLTLMMRKSNGKIVELTKTLKRRKAITVADATRVLAMQPFPQH